MTYTTSYELGPRTKIEWAKGPLVVSRNKAYPIMGISLFARDEATGEYVQVFEVGPTEWVDNEPQAWSRGNFETMQAAQHFGTKAYRWINRKKGR